MALHLSWRVARNLRNSGVFGFVSGHGVVSRHLEGVKAVNCGVRTVSFSRRLLKDKVTHTGQEWEANDYRNVRFIDKEKQVNEQFAINLLAEEPVIVVKGTHTWCDGERGALGHPKVYINLDKPEINDCGYCGKRFLSEKNKNAFPKEKFVDQ